MKGAAWVLASLGLAVAVIYGQVVEHEFVDWDDYGYFVDSPALDGRLSGADLVAAFSETRMANWSPLTSLTILVGDAIHGPTPTPYLLGNVVLHLLASVLLFLWLLRATNRLLPSAWVALIFAVHPLHVESVAWASERKDVLAAVFWMSCLLAYVFYSERPGRGRYAAVLILSVLACLSKPTAVALPVSLLLLDYWPLRRLERLSDLWPRLREKALIIVCALVLGGLTVFAQGEAGANSTTLVPWMTRFLNAGLSYWTYIGQSFWPAGLAVFYPYPEAASLRGWVPWLAWTSGIVLTGLAVWASPQRRYVLMGWLWFILTLIPMMGFVQVGGQAHADRYMYIPLIGLLVVVAGFWAECATRRGWVRWVWGLAFVLVAGLMVVARQQVGHWENTKALFEHALDVTQSNAIAHRHLGVAYWTEGNWGAGEEHLRAAVQIRPNWAESRVALADALNQSGRHQEAQVELGKALGLGLKGPGLHASLGTAAQALGDDAKAAEAYRAALQGGGGDWQIMNNLAWILAQSSVPGLRDPDAAIQLVTEALAREPGHPELLDTLGVARAAALADETRPD